MDESEAQRAPADYTEREGLRKAMRAAMFESSGARLAALRARDAELRAQWGEEHAEEIAAQEQRDREAMESQLQRERVIKRMVQGDFEAMCIVTELEHARINANNRAFEEMQRAEKAEAEAEKLKNRFGLSEGQLDFCPRELYEIALKNGYGSKKRAFLAFLNKLGHGEGVRVSFADAEEVLSTLLAKSRKRGS